MTTLALAALALLLQAAPPAMPDVAAEVERGIRAYNTQDLAYYQSALLPDAVYIADDGATFAGKERVIGLFTRIFARPTKPQLAIADVVTGGHGDVAWARFEWTLSGSDKPRPGLATAIFVKGASGWQIASIQNTAKGHAAHAAPAPGASPAAHHH